MPARGVLLRVRRDREDFGGWRDQHPRSDVGRGAGPRRGLGGVAQNEKISRHHLRKLRRQLREVQGTAAHVRGLRTLLLLFQRKRKKVRARAHGPTHQSWPITCRCGQRYY